MNGKGMWWWEKTIEYMFVRTIMTDNSLAAPMAGKPEKWLGDLVEQVEDKFRLIEFKRTTDASSENEKYCSNHSKACKCEDYIGVCKSIKNNEDVAHWLVFGDEIDGELKLKYRQYFQDDSKDKPLESSGNLSTMNFADFKAYIEELMKLRGPKEDTSSGGLVLAGVGDDQVTALSLDEFIHVIPSLELKLTSDSISSHSNSPKI